MHLRLPAPDLRALQRPDRSRPAAEPSPQSPPENAPIPAGADQVPARAKGAACEADRINRRVQGETSLDENWTEIGPSV